MFDVVHFASDLRLNMFLSGPRLCIPDEKKVHKMHKPVS